MTNNVTEQSGSLTCQCGQCRLILCDPRMRYRLECLCFDCRQRGLQFASKRPENVLTPDILNYERGVDDVYFANAFVVSDESRDLLAFTKLREDAFNTTAMATCCGTYMCGVHPVYEGASISVNADSCVVSVPEYIPSQALLFGCDFPPEKYKTLLTTRDVPKLYSVYDEADREEMIAFLNAVRDPLAENYKAEGYVTFEQLCSEKDINLDNSFFDQSRQGKLS